MTVGRNLIRRDSIALARLKVQGMSSDEMIRFYYGHKDRGLANEDADLFQAVADALGIKIRWIRYHFNSEVTEELEFR